MQKLRYLSYIFKRFKQRNFRSRNDGNKDTMNFLASPTIVTAMAFSGKLSFDPTTDSIPLPSGGSFKFNPPVGEDLPSQGFALGDLSLYPAPNPEPQPDTEIKISPTSTRLEILKPFESPFGPQNPRGLELPSLKVLMRVRGKCTTDHISAAVRINKCHFEHGGTKRLCRDHGSSIKGISRISQKIYVSPLICLALSCVHSCLVVTVREIFMLQ